jgi:hypothetical protein
MLLSGLTMYARDNDGAYPPPGQVWTLLVQQKYFERRWNGGGPSDDRDAPPFFGVVVSSKDEKRSAASRRTRPLVFANPQFFSDGSTSVGFTDGDVGDMGEAQLKELIRACGGTVELVR